MARRFAEKYLLLLLGVLIGVAYGLFTRIVFGQRATLVSLSFLFLVPTVLGIIPLVFANDAQIRSYRYIIFIPWLTVVAFFLTMLAVGIESSICLLIIGAPFFILGTVGALTFMLIRIHIKKKNTLLTLIIIPFLFSPIEEAINTPSQVYTVASEVTINSTPDRVWNNIIRVPEIKDSEYNPGFFNYLGVPRPIEAELSDEHTGAQRIGHFQDGLTFIEHITDWQPNKKVSFDIVVDPQTIRPAVFDQHVLKGDYFKFIEASYELEQTGDNQIKLRLVSNYRLTSKVNFYNKFWGDLLLKDFQDRLLAVIKFRCDQ